MPRQRKIDTPEMPIAPMIDCVFLMLVYFMTTSSLEKSEADLTFPAGSAGSVSDPLKAIDEQQLRVGKNGNVLWNGSSFSMIVRHDEAKLVDRLRAFKASCVASGSEPSLCLIPEAETPHQAIVTLLDAITGAGIEIIHFP